MPIAKERVPLASTRLRKRERRMKRGREAREKRYSTETQTTEMLHCWFLKYGDFMEISWDPSVRCVQSWGRLQPRKWIKPRLKFGSLAARLSPCQKSPTGVRPVSGQFDVDTLWYSDSITLSLLHFNGCHYFDVKHIKEPLSLIISVTAHRCSWNLHFPCLAASSHYCLMGLYRNFCFFNGLMEHLYKQTLRNESAVHTQPVLAAPGSTNCGGTCSAWPLICLDLVQKVHNHRSITCSLELLLERVIPTANKGNVDVAKVKTGEHVCTVNINQWKQPLWLLTEFTSISTSCTRPARTA